jgi:hypothetical protein
LAGHMGKKLQPIKRWHSHMKYNKMWFRAEFTIQEGKIEEYKKLVQDMSKVVEIN